MVDWMMIECMFAQIMMMEGVLVSCSVVVVLFCWLNFLK